MMLTSFEVMQAANISRATLNNYISQGLLPRPVVKNPEPDAPTNARQIGYFPEEVLQRLERISQLKKEGYAMSEIAGVLKQEGFAEPEKQVGVKEDQDEPHVPYSQSDDRLGNMQVSQTPLAVIPEQSRQLRLTIEQIPYPAYMVNYSFEIIWFNDEARSELMGGFDTLPDELSARNALTFLLKGKLGANGKNRDALLQFFQLLGKGRFTRGDLLNVLTGQADAATRQVVGAIAGSPAHGTLVQLPLTLRDEHDETTYYNVYASYYREGILFIHLPAHAESDSVLGVLERRDEVIRNLLKKRLPVLTDVAALVADLQSSARICTELPANEYFELVNQVWATMEPIFRRYYGTHGKHVGDGMVYYFFPQPDCDYLYNALMCAQELKTAMRRINKEWQLRKNWLHELSLNIGLDEGHEWLGMFNIETRVEFTVLGDTVKHAARLSGLASGGAIWATKNLLSKLPVYSLQRLKYGIRRQDAAGREIFVGETYSRINELTYLNNSGDDKLHEIAALAVTEIMEIGA